MTFKLQINARRLRFVNCQDHGRAFPQRLTQVTDNRGNRITYTLDGMGNRLREEVKDAGGNIAALTTRTINALNRVASIAGAAGQTSQLGYDANGEPISSTDPLNQSTRQTLDPLRRPTATTLADNTVARQVYNPLDQLTQAIDPKGITTQYTRNAFGDVLAEASPDAGTTTYQRDAAGLVAASTDAKAQTTQITRDALGRPTQITLADGKTQALAYDPQGNISQITDPSGTTAYTRDAMGRVLQKTQSIITNPASPASNLILRTTSYQYHPGGQLAQITYPSGFKVFYRLNPSGQISQVDTQAAGASQPVTPFVTNLTYTALAQPKAWAWASGDVASRVFDADGRMSANEFASYTFDAASRITGISQKLWVKDITASTSSTPTPATQQTFNWTLGYDNRNRLTSLQRKDANAQTGSLPTATSTYTYDANSNRLTGVETASAESDFEGEFDSATNNGVANNVKQTQTIPPTSNRLLGFSQIKKTILESGVGYTTTAQVNFSLDANGNLTSDGLRSFEHDATNRLAAVKLSQSPEAAKVTYLHNALGQRVFKSEPQVAQTAPNASTLGTGFTAWLQQNFGWLFAPNAAASSAMLGQSYVYDEQANLLGEYGNGGANPQTSGSMEYIWLPTESGQAIPIGLARNQSLYAVHGDHLGTPRLVTDATKVPVWQWPYSGFGANKPTGIMLFTPAMATVSPGPGCELSSSGLGCLSSQASVATSASGSTSSSLCVPFPCEEGTVTPARTQATVPALNLNLRFPGQYFDEESNLNYNYFRSYQPTQGRFTQSDPIGLSGGLNRFGYVGGNPLSMTDPMGLMGGGGNHAPQPPLPAVDDPCVAKYINDNYGNTLGFITQISNLQQFFPSANPDYLNSAREGLNVVNEKLIATKGPGAVGNALMSRIPGNLAIGHVVGSGLAGFGGLASGVVEVAGAFMTPFGTTAMAQARAACSCRK